MTTPRLCSKTTDKLALVLDFLKYVEWESVLLTWDHIEDKDEGAVLLPVLDIKRKRNGDNR